MNPNDFNIATDFPLDKIIHFQTGSLVVSDYNELIIPHGLSFAPLVRIRWSYESTFKTSYDLSSPLSGLSVSVDARANATNIIVRGIYLLFTASQTIYFKTYGLMPSNVNAKVAPTQAFLDFF